MAASKGWIEEMDLNIVRMYAEKATLEAVGLAVGMSRNAVSNRLKKLGETVRSGATSKFSHGRSPKIGPEKTELPFEDVNAVHLLALEPHQCRWPIGLGPTQFFCGAPQADATAYCMRHAMVAYKPIPQDRPNASRPHFIKVLARRLNTQHIHGSDFE